MGLDIHSWTEANQIFIGHPDERVNQAFLRGDVSGVRNQPPMHPPSPHTKQLGLSSEALAHFIITTTQSCGQITTYMKSGRICDRSYSSTKNVLYCY